ncbi:hypothetical protein P7K49_000035 [Saguinus oedipus]|uniref:Uncharacterized protein n=1 Tax=Saguinus oedipus TaxID=9490 RepID=A0ABQ9WAK1_SAGOE|nr:hypothetical protein P7K49_000035 [Saguinus oedipus]
MHRGLGPLFLGEVSQQLTEKTRCAWKALGSPETMRLGPRAHFGASCERSQHSRLPPREPLPAHAGHQTASVAASGPSASTGERCTAATWFLPSLTTLGSNPSVAQTSSGAVLAPPCPVTLGAPLGSLATAILASLGLPRSQSGSHCCSPEAQKQLLLQSISCSLLTRGPNLT